ncbi:MAG: rod shape-determining protein MreC [Verrucomicrobiota bacterium]|jgi:rod shape-determining protein MreC
MFFKRPQYIALGVVVVLTIVLLKLPSRAAANFKLAIRGMFLPMDGVSSSTGDLAVKAGYGVLPRHVLVQKIEELEREKQAGQVRLMQADEVFKQNARLTAQFGIPRQYPWNIQLARVVARDPANWWRTIRIDRGSRDGIVTNAPVLTTAGLVGLVSEVGYAQSQVLLLGDPGCRVSVRIAETREHGMIDPSSSSPLDDTLVELKYLSRNSKPLPGQLVVTSGQGPIFPAGIVVGQVADVRTAGYGLYKEARVSLAVKMNTLEEVWVKMP